MMDTLLSVLVGGMVLLAVFVDLSALISWCRRAWRCEGSRRVESRTYPGPTLGRFRVGNFVRSVRFIDLNDKVGARNHQLQTLVVNAQLKVKTIDELIALSKTKPGTLNYLTASVPLALYMETLKKEKGADWVRVPFKGGGEAVNAVLSGSTPIALIGEGNVIGQIRAGTMTPLVMVNNIKSPNFPQVPTLAETGYSGPPSRSWYGLFMPAGTPRAIVDKLAKEVAVIVADPAFRERHLRSRSLVPAINTPEQFAAEIRKDRAQAQEVVKASGLEPQ